MSILDKIKNFNKKLFEKTPIGQNKTLLVDIFVLFIFIIAAVSFRGIYSSLSNDGYSSTLIWNSWYPYEGRYGRYQLSGPITTELGANEIVVTVASVDVTAGTSTLSIKLKNEGSLVQEDSVIVNSQTGKIVSGAEAGKFLIFYIETSPIGAAMLTNIGVQEHDVALTYTGLTGAAKEDFLYLGIEMHYHDEAFGPQFSMILESTDDNGLVYCHQWNDASTGTLLEAEYYTSEGRSRIVLVDGNIELTGPNRFNAFWILLIAVLAWALFHLWRLKKNPEDQYFNMDAIGISRFIIRATSVILFDYMGIMFGTPAFNVTYNLIALILMIYACGPFGLFVGFRFIGLIPGVMWPFGVPLCLIVVVAYDVYCLQATKIKKLESPK